MATTQTKIHPHKFQMWIAIASIIMAFAGLTSAYIIKMNQSGWRIYDLPTIFVISTVVILASSGTMFLAVQNFKARKWANYRLFVTVTAALGVLFAVLQIIGFTQVEHGGIKLTGKGSSASGSFLLVIAGLHILHVLGGVIALIVQFFRAFSRASRTYSAVPIEVTATYWHFVDILWIYLMLFFTFVRP
jgi:cytochrome c oxidase subunit III